MCYIWVMEEAEKHAYGLFPLFTKKKAKKQTIIHRK